jgi:glutamate/tyrosine decarboxylase-like PLP-dependent enzyme
VPEDRVSPLEWTSATREHVGRAALEWALRWFDDTGARALYPAATAAEMQQALAGPLPVDGADPLAVLAEFAAHVAGGSRDNGHPRMFGYVQSSGTFAGAVADFLASTLNQNVTSWRSAPAATTVERQVVGWLRQIVGFEGDGLLVSGGSMANFVGLAAAAAAAHPDVVRRGMRALPADPVVYASPLSHMSIPKALAMCGLGRDALRYVAADADGRLDPAALDAALGADVRAGRLPIGVVANAGDVNTGCVDPLDAIADVCSARRVWLHADAAYGGFSVLAPSGRALFRGLERVDSMSLDPHKWLFAPVDCGCVLVRDRTALQRAFSYAADYVDVVATPEMSEYAFWDYGPELSRRFRALKIWFALKTAGIGALSEAIERNLALARRLAALIDDSVDFERLAPATLGIVCFRYVHGGGDLDERNSALMLRVQRGGHSYLSSATVRGCFALRACLVNHRTRETDLTALLDEIRRCAVAASAG